MWKMIWRKAFALLLKDKFVEDDFSEYHENTSYNEKIMDDNMLMG